MTKKEKSRKRRARQAITQIDVLEGVRKALPPATVVYRDKRKGKRERARLRQILCEDESFS
jgi:hypothetical protein